jgi:site-specific recombinase XerC
LKRFEVFLRDRKLRVTQFKRQTVPDFINYLSENKGRTKGDALAPATISRQLAIVSSYFDYLVENTNGKIRNPMERVKRPKAYNQIPRAIDDLALSTVIDGITDLRDKAMILLFIYSGLRLSELRQLCTDNDAMYPLISTVYVLSKLVDNMRVRTITRNALYLLWWLILTRWG